MQTGIYEELVTKLVKQRIDRLPDDQYYINRVKLDKEEAAIILARHLSQTIKTALSFVKGDGDSTSKIEQQIDIANKIIHFLKDELNQAEFEGDLVEKEGEILNAVFNRVDSHFSDLDLRLKEITPYTRLTHSELFTGGNVGLSLDSELKKEILSSDRIDLLVSFIKFKGIIILERELREFTERGGRLRVITTTYMGATDYRAIQMLSELPNTQVKISYNTGNERLHAKAYLFFRNTGFHTGYIGSSNFSRTALTDGLEWNIKVTTKEVGHIIDKFQKTFESYWQNSDFELFDVDTHSEKLKSALKQGGNRQSGIQISNFFDIKPHPFQLEILEQLDVERRVHDRHRNLIVAATGTGKTVISAFDFKRFQLEHPHAKLLFVAHRKEILEQAQATYQGILRDNNFGELWVDGLEPERYNHVFASVQTLNNRIEDTHLSPKYYDYVVIDECHHIPANSYRGIVSHFKPQILLGLTATPERMDGGDIREDFGDHIAAEIRLPEALNRKLLCPFQYFGVSDYVDLSTISWSRGKYNISELTNIYMSEDRRVGEIIQALHKYTRDPEDVRALGFCVSMEHARYMADKFSLAGFRTDYLTSENTLRRDDVKQRLVKKDINYLFVVDIFNEGVDIPEVDTVLFLRPTESLTVFLQQLGRGLRLADGKDGLTVLDFVGNARPEYNFANKFRALVGKTNTKIEKEVEDNFPHLPLGCSIILERKAKEIILDNIRAATNLSRNNLVQKIRSFEQDTDLPLNLANFVEFYDIPLQVLYKRGGWKKLLHESGKLKEFDERHASNLVSAIGKKWLSTRSTSYFKFILRLANQGFQIRIDDFSIVEKQMLLMLHYDVWKRAGRFESMEASIRAIGINKMMVEEIAEVLELIVDRIDFLELDIELPFEQPLKVHGRYTRDQIFAALQFSTLNRKWTGVAGVANHPTLKFEALFINLVKTEADFSPTTMFDDYAVNETIFHWQTQNAVHPETTVGQDYINHKALDKKILLFIREKPKDEFGNRFGYVFVGDGSYMNHYGASPMSIHWELNEPLPRYLWKDAAKLQVG
jgi:superfamily II DNA or RNA helicase